MSTIYLQVIVEKNWGNQDFDFLSFWGALTHTEVFQFSNFLLQLKIQRPGSKSGCGFSIILILEGIMAFRYSQRDHTFCRTKTNFNKNETKSKMENPPYTFRKTNLVLQLM